jgi:hypothetical protein
MKEKVLLAIVITFALSCVQELSASTVSRPKPQPVEFAAYHIASLWGIDR